MTRKEKSIAEHGKRQVYPLHLENQAKGLTVLQKQILDKIEILSDYAVETLKDIKNYEGIDNDIIKYRGGKR